MSERVVARVPLGGTDLPPVRVDELRGLELPHQFFGGAADSVVMDLDGADDHVRVDDEGPAQRKPLVLGLVQRPWLDVHAKSLSDLTRGVCSHGELDLLYGRRRIVPRLVGKYRVRRHADNLGVEVFGLLVGVGKLFELGRTHKREVGWIKEQDDPLFAFVIRKANLLDFIAAQDLELEIGYRLTHLDYAHMPI